MIQPDIRVVEEPATNRNANDVSQLLFIWTTLMYKNAAPHQSNAKRKIADIGLEQHEPTKHTRKKMACSQGEESDMLVGNKGRMLRSIPAHPMNMPSVHIPASKFVCLAII